MRKCCLLAAFAAALGLSGCLSVDHATLKDGREHVVVRNYGWNLFNWIPLFCGNATKDAFCPVAFFCDDVTMEKIHARFDDYAGGRQVETPVFVNYDTTVYTVFGIPIPYIFCYKEVSLSGTCK